MKLKAVVYNIDKLDYIFNADLQVAICDLIFDAIDSPKPDITVGFGPSASTFIIRGDAASVKRGAGAIIDAVDASVYPFDRFKGELKIRITSKEES